MTRVLIVEDSRSMRKVLRRALVSCGLRDDEIVEASDGHQGLEQIAAHDPGLVLSDINMPGLRGDVMIERLRSEGRLAGRHLVVVTSRYDAPLFEKLLDDGAEFILRKPFAPHALHRHLEPLVSELRQRDELPGVAFGTAHLDTAMVKVLEEMTFLSAGRDDAALPTVGDVFVAGIPVADGGTHLVLGGDRAAASEIAHNLTGEPALDDTDRLDAIGELANVVVGEWLALADSTKAGVPFGTPTLSVQASSDGVPNGAMGFVLDETDQHVFAALVVR